MRPTLFRIATALLGIVACAWPLDVYQHVPLTGQTVTSLAAALLIGVWLIDLALHRTPRLPFELLWPLVLLVVVSMAVRADNAPTIVGLALFFCAALHFARDRNAIERWLTWSAAACFLVAVAELGFRAGYGWPAAYALPRDPAHASRALDAVSAVSGTLANGSATLVAGTVLWAAIAYYGLLPRGVAIAGFLVTLVASIWNVVGNIAHIPTDPNHWLSGGAPKWIASGLAIWLGARIGAKILVDRNRRPGVYAVVVAPLIGLALVALATAVEPMAWHAWGFALAAGYVIRDKRAAPGANATRLPVYAGLALLPFVASNAYIVDESNPYDGRNYVEDMRADYESGELDRLMNRVEFWFARTGRRPAQGYWAARAALKANRPHAAAALTGELAGMRSTHGPRRPFPTDADVEQLLNEFRDYISALPPGERGIVYERALCAAWDTVGAEASLRLRIADANPVYESIERGPLERAVPFLFGDGGPQIDFSTWTIAELIAVLDLVGARIEPAPEEIDRAWLPATVVVRRDARRIAVCATSAASSDVAYRDAPMRLDVRPTPYPENPWSTAPLPFDASWQVELHPAGASEPAAATATFGKDGSVGILFPESWTETVPDESAVFVWLP